MTHRASLTTGRRPLPRGAPALLSAGLLALTTLATTACGGDEAVGTRLTAVLDTVNGVERFRYPASGAPRLEWALDTTLVLGDAFAEVAYQFNEINSEGLAAVPGGELLVLDRQGKRLLRYGPDGGHLGTFGREGEGPGELAQPLGLALGPGDTAWVSDFSNGRLTGYPLEGGDPRVVAFPENSGFPSFRMAAVDDVVLLQFRPLFNFRQASSGGGVRMSRGDGSEEEAEVMLPLVRYGRSALAPGDTLWSVPEAPTDIVQLEMGDRLMVTMMSREFHPEFMWDVFSDGGVVVSDTAAYLLRVVDPDGTVRRVLERDPAPRPTTEADRLAVKERLRTESEEGIGIRMGGGGPDEEAQRRILEQRLEKMTFADLVPRVVSLRVDPRDRIWVGVAEEVADSMARIDIYDRDGTLLGELREFPMPDVFLSDGRVGVVRKDELDVQQIVLMDVDDGTGTEMAGAAGT